VKIYAILRRSDNGEALPDGFCATADPMEGNMEAEAQLALVSALLDTLGYYVEFEQAGDEAAGRKIEEFWAERADRSEYMLGVDSDEGSVVEFTSLDAEDWDEVGS
jgi:hypothetical protein